MSNLFTFLDAKNFVSPFVDNGSCDPALLSARVNEALRRLMVKAEWPYTTQAIRIRTNNLQFPLPRECEKVIWANVCGAHSYTFNQSYEFMAAGPGELKHRSSKSGMKDLVDAGMFPTMYDIPAIEKFDVNATDCTDRDSVGDGLQLMAFSTEPADASKELTIFGADRMLNDIDASAASNAFTPGETLKINMWKGGVEGSISVDSGWNDILATTKEYRHLSHWAKPVTKGYISLYAVDISNRYMYFLAKAHPDDLQPTWRRYKVSGQECTDDCANVLALCKMKALTLKRDTDILCIQNLDAVKNMVMAISLENAQDLQGALQYESNATRLLVEQKQDHDQQGGFPVIVDFETMIMGSPMNRRII